MKSFLHILKYKALSYLRFESTITLSGFIKNSASGIIYLAFAFGAFYFSYSTIAFLMLNIKIGLFLLHQFISMVLFIFFVSINVGNIIVSYSTLYKSQEINYYFSKPVKPEIIFTIKFLDNFFYSSGTLLMVLFSLLAGYLYYFNISIIAGITLLLSFIPYMFSAGSLGVIILLIIIKLSSRYGLKKILYSLASIYLLSIILFFDLNSPGTLVKEIMKSYPYIDKDIYLSSYLPDILEYLPHHWLAQSGFWIIKGNFIYAAQFIFLQTVLSAILFLSALTLGRKWYLNTWLISTGFSNQKRKQAAHFSFLNKSRLNPQTESLFKKDILLFFREPSQIIHSIILLFLIIIFTVSASGIKFIGFGNFYLQTMIYLSIYLFNLLLISTLSLRFIFPLTSLEGEYFWKLRTAPIQLKKYILTKLTPYSAIILGIALLLSFFTNYKFGFEITLFAVLSTFLSAIAILAINYGMGTIYANYKEKNPIRVSSSQGASLTFLICAVYMVFMILLFFRPMSDYFLAVTLNNEFSYRMIFYGSIPVLIISVILTYLFMKAAVHYLRKDF
jgi:ABC-2 type transport system permease protein